MLCRTTNVQQYNMPVNKMATCSAQEQTIAQKYFPRILRITAWCVLLSSPRQFRPNILHTLITDKNKTPWKCAASRTCVKHWYESRDSAAALQIKFGRPTQVFSLTTHTAMFVVRLQISRQIHRNTAQRVVSPDRQFALSKRFQTSFR